MPFEPVTPLLTLCGVDVITFVLLFVALVAVLAQLNWARSFRSIRGHIDDSGAAVQSMPSATVSAPDAASCLMLAEMLSAKMEAPIARELFGSLYGKFSMVTISLLSVNNPASALTLTVTVGTKAGWFAQLGSVFPHQGAVPCTLLGKEKVASDPATVNCAAAKVSRKKS